MAQDSDNMMMTIEAQEHIRFGRVDDIRAMVDKTPGFSTLTSGFFDMSLVDQLLCDAANSKQASTEMVEILLDLGGNPTQSCIPGVETVSATALSNVFNGLMMTLPRFEGSDKILKPPMFPAERVPGETYLEIAELLLDETSDPDLDTILFRSSLVDSRAVEFLLDEGADPDAPNETGITTRELVDAYIDYSLNKLQWLEADTAIMPSDGVQP